jgi:hypothetical protein
MQYYCGFIFKAFAQSCALNLGGEETAHVVSNSELESLYSSWTDDKEILECFLNLSCCSFNKEKEKRPKKCREYSAEISSLAFNGNNHFCNSNAEHLRECVTAWKALSHANAKGKGINSKGWVGNQVFGLAEEEKK